MKTREELLDRYENEPTASKFSKSDKVLSFTPEELKEVLDAPTEEQMKCSFCRDMSIKDYHQHLEEDTINDSAYNDKVKYCEVCGRKL